MDAERIQCYRGIARDNLHYPDALLGKAVPRGGWASLSEHCLGDTDSKYTSWTTDREVAVEKALDSTLGGRGVILAKVFLKAELTASPDFYEESEVLVKGVVADADIEWVP